MRSSVLVLMFFVFSHILFGQGLDPERVDKLKKSIVKILIDGKSNGTGFIISNKCEVITCWHVILGAVEVDSESKVTLAKKVEIEFYSGERIQVSILTKLMQSGGYVQASGYDYCILLPASASKTKFESLKLGNFSSVNEGDQVYICGYPLGIQQQFISMGLLSTKWVDTAYAQRNTEKIYMPRNVAWLDLTMNRGNSGGPIIKLGRSPSEDVVVGIATFILSPSADDAEKLAMIYSLPGSDVIKDGISEREVNRLFSQAIANNSVGISGCVSIDYIKFFIF